MPPMEAVLCQGDMEELLAWLRVLHRRGQFDVALEWEAGDFDGVRGSNVRISGWCAEEALCAFPGRLYELIGEEPAPLEGTRYAPDPDEADAAAAGG